MTLQMGKIPIVVPRQSKYNEHVNNHQLDFAKAVEKRQENIIVVDKINDLADKIFEYDEIIASKQKEYKSNNDKFSIELEKIVEELFKGK